MREARDTAPGRVNLIGEHTDYHEGYVLPCAVPQQARAYVRVRADATVHAVSAQVREPVTFTIGEERATGTWGDYVAGLTWALRQAGHAVRGFDLHLDSSIPPGSGLSSSAALEVATLRALRTAFALDFADVELARLAQRAEVEFVGAPVGIMDQMASTFATERDALFLDTRTLHYERIPLPASAELIVIDSGISHQHAGGDYGTRRRESEEAARVLGVRCLRDVTDVEALGTLPPTSRRRARHIVTENARVLAACEALRRADARALGLLFSASQASMRDDYEISIPEIDLLVQIAEAQPDVFGARMTGGGFGGAIVALAVKGAGGVTARTIAETYACESGRHPTVLVP